MKSIFDMIQTQKQGKVIKDFKEMKKLLIDYLRDKDYLLVKGSNSTGLHNFLNKMKVKKNVI